MDPTIVAAAIGGGTSLISSILGGSGASKAAAATVQAQKKANKFNRKENITNRKFARNQAAIAREYGSEESQKERDFNAAQAEIARNFEADQNETDRFLQEKFAKNSTGWAFDDLMEAADDAGIHRLAALGGATATPYTPVGGSSPQAGGSGAPGSPMADFGGSIPAQAAANTYAGSVVGEGIGIIGETVQEAMAAKYAAEKAKSEEHRQMFQDARRAIMEGAQLDVLKSEANRNNAAAAREIADARSRTLIGQVTAAAQGATTGGNSEDRPVVDDPSPGYEDSTFFLGDMVLPKDIPGIDELVAWPIIEGMAGIRTLSQEGAKHLKKSEATRRKNNHSIRW